ncbi:MAG: FAD-dependent oxidoreductase, partial [Chloroflexota bacterium]
MVADQPLASEEEWASKLDELAASGTLSPDCQVTLYWSDGVGLTSLTDEGVELSVESLGGLSACEEACPLGQSGQSYLLKLADGQFDEAFALIYRDNLFPASCGRVCHKCEPLCNRGKIDAPVRVATLKSFAADRYYADHSQVAEPAAVTRGDRVAVVGGGPCGLTAARRLVQLGYPTTVFESMPVAGGQLAIGIPHHRLPRDVVQREVDEIRKLGVEVRLSSSVNDVEALFADGYRAVIVATGSSKPSLHPAVGDSWTGVLLNTEFLADAKLGRPVEMGRSVLVIGGGNVAMDCARTARRLGNPEVTIACVESWQKMPAHGHEIEAAVAEGIRMQPATAIVEVLRDGEGRVTAVVAARVLKMEMRPGGSPVVQHDPESLFTIPCDTILLAMGQTPRADLVSRSAGVVVGERGEIAVDSGFATGRPGLFAAGDAVTVVGSVAAAIGAGNRVAEAAHRYL